MRGLQVAGIGGESIFLAFLHHYHSGAWWFGLGLLLLLREVVVGLFLLWDHYEHMEFARGQGPMFVCARWVC